MDVEVAHLAHYREGCQARFKDQCETFMRDTVEDLTILKYKGDLLQGVKKAMQDLGFSSE